MVALPVISIVLCLAYIIFVVFRYGVPVSLSETYYLLPGKWDWLFSAWCTLTAVPFGIWWFSVAPSGLRWMPVVVVLGLCLVGVSCRYKSGPKHADGYVPKASCERAARKGKSFREFLAGLRESFRPSVFLRYGWARPLHYVASLLAVGTVTAYLCVTSRISVVSMVFSYVMFIIIGIRTPGVYNRDYSVDVDNKAWIFFLEVVCLTQLFVFVWSTI